MGDKRAGHPLVRAAYARRLAVAAILITLPGLVTAPQATAVPVPQGVRAANPDAGHAAHGAPAHGGGTAAGKAAGRGKAQGKAQAKPRGKGQRKGRGNGREHGGEHGRGRRLAARLAGGFGGPAAGRGGPGGGRGGGTQYTEGVNTSNAPTISSPATQISAGRRNVNAPAGNSAVTFAGVQQVSSVSVFTDTQNGNCRSGIRKCWINQNLESTESRGGIGR